MVEIEWCKREVMTLDMHKNLLEILCAFDKVCTKYNIQYSLHGGTMLGAIREHGFIPWDDDADISMTRDNFAKLIAVLDANDTDYYVKGRIKKQFYKVDDKQVWVDIFICDYISENGILQRIKLFLLTMLDIMYRDRESMKLSDLKKYSKVKQFLYKSVYFVGRLFSKKWIAQRYAYISEKCLLGNKGNMFRSNDQYNGRKMVFPSAWMKTYEYVQFENIQLPVCSESHALLAQSYGQDYMTPIHEERNIIVHNFVRSKQKIEL